MIELLKTIDNQSFQSTNIFPKEILIWVSLFCSQFNLYNLFITGLTKFTKQDPNNRLLYSIMKEQINLALIKNYYQRYYPVNSFTITMLQQIYNWSPILYIHIQHQIPILFLPNPRILFNTVQRSLLSINEITRANSICYLAILDQLSLPIKNSRDKMLAVYIDEINITPILILQNKHLFLGNTHNELTKEATNLKRISRLILDPNVNLYNNIINKLINENKKCNDNEIVA